MSTHPSSVPTRQYAQSLCQSHRSASTGLHRSASTGLRRSASTGLHPRLLFRLILVAKLRLFLLSEISFFKVFCVRVIYTSWVSTGA